ncbi:hypothetical protein Tdes44962_MAKER04686 [Teratosphaeria destructans]|uniref:Uncharacterized protein n=1 Tax=Teratosphaeria destructans TaxID=418781 RepID=A0A9W7SLQ0_9PEZI|nr:hypothetical protein Tdes44962_MAKER04686 [Teratosphaeria destructans]
MAKSSKPAPITPSTVTPPSLDRCHSYTTKTEKSTSKATAVLADLRYKSTSPGSSPCNTPLASPLTERRTSWEETINQRDGYISFPDFDSLKAKNDGQ